MTVETPQPRDRVRVIYEGMADEFDDHGRLARVTDSGTNGDWISYIPESATVEVLERADDPSRDPIGTFRRENHTEENDPPGHSIWQAFEDSYGNRRWLCVFSTTHGNRGETLTDNQVVGMKVVGYLPGSPAAYMASMKVTAPSVRVVNEPHVQPIPVRHQTEYLTCPHCGSPDQGVRGITGECAEWHGLIREFGGPRPTIVVLCGSTRFVDEFNRQRKLLTEAGLIVLSIEVVTSQPRESDPQHTDPVLKARLDELHKRKIDLADEVFVLNVGGYIGESTRSEIEYAEKIGRPVDYLEPIASGVSS